MATSKSGRSRALALPKGVELNARNKIAAMDLLSSLQDASVHLAFFDPQYRTGLDQLKFGNEGTRQKARYELPQMLDADIQLCCEEIARVLKPSGHLMLWCDKFAIGSGQHLRYLNRLRRMMSIVDLFAWNKLVIGMGRRGRCQTEYLVVVQKHPLNAEDHWTDHSMPDCWPEMKDSDRHPHAKPHQLTERLIRATTKRGQLVLDPCAGGYGVLDACKHTGRDFIGGDLL